MSGSGKSTITRLICRRQWNVLGELLRQGDSIPIDDAVGQPITSDLLVHFACRFQAPTSIVRLVANTYKESLTCADALGRFPIHVSQTYALLLIPVIYIDTASPNTHITLPHYIFTLDRLRLGGFSRNYSVSNL